MEWDNDKKEENILPFDLDDNNIIQEEKTEMYGLTNEAELVQYKDAMIHGSFNKINREYVGVGFVKEYNARKNGNPVQEDDTIFLSSFGISGICGISSSSGNANGSSFIFSKYNPDFSTKSRTIPCTQ